MQMQAGTQIKDLEEWRPHPDPSQVCPRRPSASMFRCEAHHDESISEHLLNRGAVTAQACRTHYGTQGKGTGFTMGC